MEANETKRKYVKKEGKSHGSHNSDNQTFLRISKTRDRMMKAEEALLEFDQISKEMTEEKLPKFKHRFLELKDVADRLRTKVSTHAMPKTHSIEDKSSNAEKVYIPESPMSSPTKRKAEEPAEAAQSLLPQIRQQPAALQEQPIRTQTPPEPTESSTSNRATSTQKPGYFMTFRDYMNAS